MHEPRRLDPSGSSGQHVRTSESINPFADAGVKSFDSPTVRGWEPYSAALHDVRFAIACCDELLTNSEAAVGANPTLQRALWDGVLVSVFKHYGKGANPGVKSLFDEVVASQGTQTVEAFEEWKRERNHRVAHSVGFRESQHIVVLLPASPGGPLRVTGVPFSALRPEDAGIHWVREVLVAIADRLFSEADKFMPDIVDEVNALTDAEILDLPDLDPPFFGPERSPGSQRGTN